MHDTTLGAESYSERICNFLYADYMKLRCVVVPSLVLLLTGSSHAENAKVKVEAKQRATQQSAVTPSAATPSGPTEIQLSTSVALRATKLTLGKSQSTGIASRPATVKQQAKGEMNIVENSRQTLAAAPATKQLNAYEQAFEDLRAVAANIEPTLTARGEVSFVVGKNGEPTRAVVFGFSSALDAAMTQHLTSLRFPSKDAGQYYTAKLTVYARPVTKPATRPSKTKSNARVAAKK